MLEAISGDGAGGSPGGPGFEEEDDNDSTYSRDSFTLDTTDEAPNYANNVRIKSKKFLRDAEAEEEAGTCWVGLGWAAIWCCVIFTNCAQSLCCYF